MKKLFSATRIICVALLLSSSSSFAKEVDWGTLNPAFAGATFVKDSKVCLTCHEESQKHYEGTAHFKAFKNKMPEAGDCESCHGPRSKHVESAGKDLAMSPSQQGKACLQCHEGGERKHWSGSAHSSDEVNCTSCHTVMKKVSASNLLSKPTESDTCYTCHTNVRGELNKMSHHPVREGKINCSDCHNVHGSATESMLKGNSLNESCYKCHQEKRGPFVWEHAPVRENCLACHEAHGSNNRKLQNAKDSFLCLQCHTYGGHINSPRYNRTSNPTAQGCVNCHMAIHGSNSPSGPNLTR